MKQNIYINRRIGNLRKNKLIKNGSILFIGTSISSIGNYFYNVFLARFLGPINFGLFITLVAITSVFSIFSPTIKIVVSKFIANLKAQEDYFRIYYFLNRISQKVFLFSIMVFLFFIFCSPFISSFLRIPFYFLLLLGLIFLVIFLVTVNNGALLGAQYFIFFTGNTLIETFVKLTLGATLVFLGFAIKGAIFALLISLFVSYLISSSFLKKVFRGDGTYDINWAEIKNYAYPVFFTSSGFLVLLSLDLILARRFLEPFDVGLYAVLSVLGRVVFFASGPFVEAMFPMVSENHYKNEKKIHFLWQTLIFISILSLSIITFYFLYPKLIISLLFGKNYLKVSGFLGLMGISMFLYSLSNVLVYYSWAVNRTNVAFLPLVAGLLQGVLILFFHRSISDFVFISLFAMSILLISLVVFLSMEKKLFKAYLIKGYG